MLKQVTGPWCERAILVLLCSWCLGFLESFRQRNWKKTSLFD